MMKDELAVLVNRELKDPRVPSITITDVQITRDVKLATVFFSVLSIAENKSDPEITKIALDGLNSAKGYLKRQISQIMNLRMMPDLQFKEDKGLENTLRVAEILKQLEEEKKSKAAATPKE
ncbi:MAG: 30S ribosome-binding factor RbfA [Bdellovibrionales bacterium]|nr:30S ribosome-binding factor RbfA [Bdellovibrionales bacterium]